MVIAHSHSKQYAQALPFILKFLIPRLALKWLIPRSALKVHELYISHEIDGCSFPRASSVQRPYFFCTEALVLPEWLKGASFDISS